MYDVGTGRLKYVREGANEGIGIRSLKKAGEPFLTTSPVLNRHSLSARGVYIDDEEFKMYEKMASTDFHEMNGTSLLFTEHAASNFGHFLLDNLYAAFAILTNLGIHDAFDTQLLLRSFSNRERQRLDENWSPLFLSKPIIMDDILKNLRSKGVKYIRFHALAIGGPYGLSAGVHSVHSRLIKAPSVMDYNKKSSYKFATGKNFNRGDQIHKLREVTMSNLDIDPNFVPRTHLIVILDKKGKRAIKNVSSLYLHLKKKFPLLKVKLVDPSKIELRDQIILMSKATVLITPRGGISFIGMYQSPGAFSICLESPDPAWRITENEYFWQNLNYLKQIMYPVSPIDLDCSTKLSIDNCDINVDPVKMSSYVEQALFEMSL